MVEPTDRGSSPCFFLAAMTLMLFLEALRETSFEVGFNHSIRNFRASQVRCVGLYQLGWINNLAATFKKNHVKPQIWLPVYEWKSSMYIYIYTYIHAYIHTYIRCILYIWLFIIAPYAFPGKSWDFSAMDRRQVPHQRTSERALARAARAARTALVDLAACWDENAMKLFWSR